MLRQVLICILLLLLSLCHMLNIWAIASSDGIDIISRGNLFLDYFGRLRPVIGYGDILNLDIAIVSQMLVQHRSWPCGTTTLNCHLLIINHLGLQTLIYHMGLILLLLVLPKRLVSSNLLFCDCGFISVVGRGHWPAYLICRTSSLNCFLGLLRHALTERSAYRTSTTIINHAFGMGFARGAQLILVSAMCSILIKNWIF